MKKIITSLMIMVVLITGNVFANEIKPVLISENVPTLYKDFNLTYKGEDMNVKSSVVDGVTMLPLRETLEKAGYTVKWNGETFSIEISKGSTWTSIKVGQNAYFKNKMAARPLSKEPVIIDSKTVVPVEFFNVILGLGISVEDSKIDINDLELANHSGFIQEIQTTEDGKMSIVISSEEVSKDEMDKTIIHISKDNTILNTNLEKGKFVNVISPMVMAMSIPGQTGGIVIY